VPIPPILSPSILAVPRHCRRRDASLTGGDGFTVAGGGGICAGGSSADAEMDSERFPTLRPQDTELIARQRSANGVSMLLGCQMVELGR
jgi:hypothetical protein